MKKFLAFSVIIIELIAIVFFGTLFLVKNSEVNDLEQKNITLTSRINTLEDKIIENDSTSTQSITELNTFVDKGFGVNVEFPFTWKSEFTTNITDEFASSDDGLISGLIIDKYELVLKNGASSITFGKVLGGAGGVALALDTSTYDYKELKNDIVRYQKKGSDEWMYREKVNCSNVPTSELGDATVCVDISFPGFGSTDYITFVDLILGSSDHLVEADQIVLSAVK